MDFSTQENSFLAYDSKPWQKHYAQGRSSDLPAIEYENYNQIISQASEKYVNKPAFTICLPNGMTGTLSFSETEEMSTAFAAYLKDELQLLAGDKIALQMPNCLAYPVATFGVIKAGCVLVNINPLYTAPEMIYQLNDSGAETLIIIDMFADKLEQVLAGTAVKKVLMVSLTDFMPAVSGLLVKTVLKLKKQIPPCRLPTESFTQAVKKGRSYLEKNSLVHTVDVKSEDLFSLQYTGGTTGPSKGVMLSHHNMLANFLQIDGGLGDAFREEPPVILTVLPLYHQYALAISVVLYAYGGHNVLIPSPRPIGNLRKALEKFPITFLPGLNTLFIGLMNEQWFVDNPPAHLSLTGSGAMALQKPIAERWKSLVGHLPLEGYGLTEASPLVSATPVQGPVKVGSIGIPAVGTEVRLVDEEGRPVAVGEPGELIVRGEQVMQGYWNKPEETANTIRDGWLYTGDIARMDEDGYFWIVDRKKDMVIISGFNVYPNQIEDCISGLEGILEVGVIGVPDERTGEALKAYVVKQDPSLTAEDIISHCREFLTAYKVPKDIVFVEELPKTPVGKVLRKDLREMAQKE